MTTLDEIRQQYQTIRPLSPGAAYLMRRTVALFGAHLGREPVANDLTDLTVSGWIERLESLVSPWTRAGHRTRIMCLWRFAARRMYCRPPSEVRRAPTPEPMPTAWSAGDVGRLVDACDLLNAGAASYFRALILAAYETGLRRSDLRGLSREQIGADGTIQVRQQKTARPHVVSVRPETAAAILALPGEHPLTCRWSAGRYGAYWSRLCSIAGVSRGGCQQLRRTGATLIAVEQGEDAARRYLGHRSPEMLSYYLDRRYTQQRPVMPPRIG